jgi:hypothetical protein
VALSITVEQLVPADADTGSSSRTAASTAKEKAA